MTETYGYNPYTWELITLFESGPPDFSKAEELIRKGANVNDQGDDKDENVLSEIIGGYWQTAIGEENRDECEYCESSPTFCSRCPRSRNPGFGAAMVQIIRFFLDHGFDVNLDNGKYGARCLSSVALSTFDRYIIDATKLLFDAGAINIDASDEPEDNPLDWIITEGSYQDVSERNHRVGNYFEAVYRMYMAREAGHPYKNIDSFDTAVGKRIIRVLAEAEPGKDVFFSVDTPSSKHNNCFTCGLYFVFEGGFLKTTKEVSFWVDTEYPETSFVDVSSYFTTMIGAAIEGFSFDHRDIAKGTTHYGQPITTIRMDNGAAVSFTINFGEVEKKDYVAYYHLDRCTPPAGGIYPTGREFSDRTNLEGR